MDCINFFLNKAIKLNIFKASIWKNFKVLNIYIYSNEINYCLLSIYSGGGNKLWLDKIWGEKNGEPSLKSQDIG